MNVLYKVTGLMILGLSLMSCDALYSTGTTKSTAEDNHLNTAASSLDKSFAAIDIDMSASTTNMSESDFNKLTRAIQPNFSDKALPQSDLALADQYKRSDCGFDILMSDKAKQLT